MRAKVAKYLRREARTEMVNDGVPDRDPVWGHHSVVNSPQSVRALYLKLKQAFKRSFGRSGSPPLVATHDRHGSSRNIR